MDDEQKQNLHKKGMHNTEANVDQPNIVMYDPREGFLPVWWHNVYRTGSTRHPEESSAMAIQNVAPNNWLPMVLILWLHRLCRMWHLPMVLCQENLMQSAVRHFQPIQKYADRTNCQSL
ncbi:uncharacterized protein LOC107764873 [Nicotiana tabacum]|uniref:Uncharacterized protein LOC107764873 n=1 Tax=Nicotiana tabacum TaxID=4097 RepID=A0AC58SUC3_TOBAC